MSDLRARLKALRGEVDPQADGTASGPEVAARHAPPRRDARFEGAAAQLSAEVVERDGGLHLLVRRRWERDARHGATPLGGPGLDDRMRRWAARTVRSGADADRSGPVVYLDTETTGLAGGTGTYAFLVGVGVHRKGGFEVDQVMLPGPEHERAYLRALHDRLAGASALVSYNGASFDLPLLRTRFALHGIDDPTAGVPHLDLLPLARRLWRERLADCRLGTIERHVLRAARSEADVPGAEVPARYLAFLRTRDALGLRGVIEHNRIDIVALTALRAWFEARVAEDVQAGSGAAVGDGQGAGGNEAEGEVEHDAWDAGDADLSFALARWLEASGDEAAALRRLEAIEARHDGAVWHAALLHKRAGRWGDAVQRWRDLAARDDPRGWIELAKHHEHRRADLHAALEAAEAARRSGGDAHDDLDRRLARLRARIERSDAGSVVRET